MMSHIEKLIGLRTGLGNGQPRPNINTYLEDKVATPSNLLNPSRRVEILDQKSAAKNPWTSNCMPPDTEVGTSVYGIKKPNARHWSSPNRASARWKRGNGPEHFLDTIPSTVSPYCSRLSASNKSGCRNNKFSNTRCFCKSPCQVARLAFSYNSRRSFISAGHSCFPRHQ